MGTRSHNISPSRKRARFSKEFKMEAVRLLALGQKPAAQLALELGIQRNQLYKWQAELVSKGEPHVFRGPGAKPLEEQSEIERLKRELKRVTEERDILKKRQRTLRKNCREVRIRSKLPSPVRGGFHVQTTSCLAQNNGVVLD